VITRFLYSVHKVILRMQRKSMRILNCAIEANIPRHPMRNEAEHGYCEPFCARACGHLLLATTTFAL